MKPFIKVKINNIINKQIKNKTDILLQVMRNAGTHPTKKQKDFQKFQLKRKKKED